MDREMRESLEQLKMQVLKELCSYGSKQLNVQAFHEVGELVDVAKDLCKLITMMDNGEFESMRGSYAENHSRGMRSMTGETRGMSQHDRNFADELYSMASRSDDPHLRKRMIDLARESEAGYR